MTVRPGARATVRHPAFPAVTGTVLSVEDRGGGDVAVLDVPGAERIVLPLRYLEPVAKVHAPS